MALISPILDNRSFAQLRDELVRRIPSYAPEWTDHNESDPGIALLELFAYLGESLIYRFNQIPDTTRIEFLRLLGVRPRPALPARVLLAAATDDPRGVQVPRAAEARAGSIPFQTEDEVFVWPLEVLGAGKTPVSKDPNALSDSDADALARAEVIDPADGQFYTTVVLGADPLATDAPTIEVSAQADGALWIALLGKARTELTELAGRVLFLGVAFDETIDEPVTLQPAAQYRSTGLDTDPPPMLWRMWYGPDADQPLRELAVLRDTTKGMATTGVVELAMPEPMPAVAGTVSSGDAGSPPPLSDEKLAARVVGWLQVSRPATADIGNAIGRVRWIGVNAVTAVQSRAAAAELLGTGTGDSGQTYALNHSPVLAGSTIVEVEEPTGWVRWQEVDDFIATTATDRHFTVDYDAGTVSFGRGQVPQLGERIRALGYRYGGGTAGNVPAKAVNALAASGSITVSNPLPAAGGADRVPLTEALDAIPAEVHRHDRAVIAEDFAALAGSVSGVARAEPLPLFHPDSPAEQAAGVVSVMIFPDSDLRNPTAPVPDLRLLRQASAYLDERRLVTTELYVVPPVYVPISVSVGVVVRTGYQVDAVRRWVELIIKQYLAPVPPAGPDGKGWPLGRTVRRAELEAVAVQVDGVDYLEGLILAAVVNGTASEQELIELERWQVPAVVDVSVVAGPPLPPGTAYQPAPPPKVLVPLPPEVC
ncbi:MAG: putative baseplate assembly protein [Jatrophihabitantaceae bacterium]